ncbi:MAG TPA: hypothetical protein GX510_07720 [Firmicutes bacterium]|nr:hypothetical protein [Candidatus Fermentithermobacillaceae bacterium]
MIGEAKHRLPLLTKVSYGSSFLRRALLGKVIFVLVLTTLTCLSLLSCSPPEPAGVAVRPGMPPALRLVCGDYSIVAMRNGFTWPTDSETRVVQENPFIPPPNQFLVVQPGQEVTFGIEGTGHRPQAASLSLSYHQDYPDPQTPRRIIASEDITEFSSQGGAFTFKWRLPEAIPAVGTYGDNELPIFDLNVGVRWTQPHAAEVKYIAVLASPDESSVESSVDTCERFFHAAWSGKKNVLVELMDPKILAEREKCEEYPGAPEEVAPLSVHAVSSSWERILWQSERYSFKLKSDPEVSIVSLDRHYKVPHGVRVELWYSVEATDNETHKKSTWDFRELYSVVRGQKGKWLVQAMTRLGFPRWSSALSGQASGAKESFWEVRALRETRGSDTIVSIGDFYQHLAVHMLSGGKWSDDKRFYAFAAENLDRREIWVVGRDGTGLCRLLCLEDLPSAGTLLSRQELQVLDWVPGEHRVRFIVSGHQVTGPHAEEYGHWVGEVDAETGKVQDVAFIPFYSQGYFSARDLSVTRDRTAVLFRSAKDLWRVDFETRQASLVVPNVRPEGYDLFMLRYSPSGWYAAYPAYTPDGYQVVVYDLRTGERRSIEIDSEMGGFFLGWTPGEMFTVVLAEEKEVNRGEDSDLPAAARSVRFYDVKGELKAELSVPSHSVGESIGHWVWTPDEKALLFTTGRVVEGGMSSLSNPYLVHRAEEVWIWEDPIATKESTASGKGPRKLADVSGIVQSVEWDSINQCINIWYREAEEPRPQQSGVSVSLTGKTATLSRPDHYYSARDQDVFIAALGGKQYFRREGKDGSRVTVKDQAGKETVLLEGQFWVDAARVDGDALVLTTNTSRHLGVINRARLYLILP